MGSCRDIGNGNRGTDYQAEVEKRRRHGLPKQTAARKGRRLKMLSRLGRLKTTSELYSVFHLS